MEKKLEKQYLVLVLPGLIIFTIGLIIPLLLAFRYSFTSWDGMSAEKPFVGLRNYIDLIQDSDFRSAWWFRFDLRSAIPLFRMCWRWRLPSRWTAELRRRKYTGRRSLFPA